MGRNTHWSFLKGKKITVHPKRWVLRGCWMPGPVLGTDSWPPWMDYSRSLNCCTQMFWIWSLIDKSPLTKLGMTVDSPDSGGYDGEGVLLTEARWNLPHSVSEDFYFSLPLSQSPGWLFGLTVKKHKINSNRATTKKPMRYWDLKKRHICPLFSMRKMDDDSFK